MTPREELCILQEEIEHLRVFCSEMIGDDWVDQLDILEQNIIECFKEQWTEAQMDEPYPKEYSL